MGKHRVKQNYGRRVLRLPDLDQCKLAVLNSLGSPASRRVYQFAIDQFIAWYCSEPRLTLNRIVVVRYRLYLESRHLRNTGLRRSDAVKLTWAEIDFKNQIIRRRTQERGKFVEVPLMPELLAALEFERDQRKPRLEDVVLLNPATGGPLSPRKLTARIRTLGARAGIKRATPQRFRDTFAVDLLYKGMDIYSVAKMLGRQSSHRGEALRPIRNGACGSARQIILSGAGLEEAQFGAQSNSPSEQITENKEVVAAGPVSRIRRAALQTVKLFEISRCEVSMMSTLAVRAGFASHRRHNPCTLISRRRT